MLTSLEKEGPWYMLCCDPKRRRHLSCAAGFTHPIRDALSPAKVHR